MTCHWTPIRSDRRCEYSQPRKNVLRVNGEDLDFTNPAIVEFEIPMAYADFVQSARREDGVLHLRLLAHYRGGNAITKERTVEYTGEEVAW